MAAFLDLCRFIPTLGGTTDFVYASVVGGCQSPSAASAVNGVKYKCYAVSNDLSQWEVFEGAYNSSTGTFARTTVLFNSSGTGTVTPGQSGAGTKINFSTVPQVAVVAAAEDLIALEIANSFSAAQQSQARSNIAAGRPGMHNRLINPSGQVWQRQASNNGAAAITDITYAFDRWYGLTQTAGITISQVANAENGTPFMMRLSQANATAQRFGLAQVIESGNSLDLRGQVVVLSARVRMSASTTLRFAIIEWTGTADTVTKDFVLDWTNGTFTAGNFFTSTSTTITATGSVALTANTLTSISLSGTLGSSTNNLAVIFWTDSTQAQNVTLDIGKAQCEIGAVPSPISVRSFRDEIEDCYRYYYRRNAAAIGDVIGVHQAIAAGATVGKYFDFPVEMRVKPTGAVSAASHVTPTASNGANGGAFSSIPFETSSTRDLSTNSSGTSGGSGLSAGNATVLLFNTASGWIDATAEL
jgi:hypothetical protein